MQNKTVMKKRKINNMLNATWKVGVGMIGLFALLLAIRLGSFIYRDYFGRATWNDKTLSENVVVRAWNRGGCRVYNKKTGHYTTHRVAWVAETPENDSLTVFCDKKGYRGFLNVMTGEIVIPAQYNKAWVFSEGLAAVEYGKKQLGFINHDNEMVIKDIPYEPGYFDYVFKNGYCIVKSWDDDGDLVYSVYSSIALCKTGQYDALNLLDRGDYTIAKNKEGYWLLDSVYNRVFDEPYEVIEEAYYMEGIFVTNNWVKQRIDFDGTVLDEYVIDGTKRLSYVVGLAEGIDEDYYGDNYVSEFESDLIVYRVGNNTGLMNAHTGKIITPAKYGDITMISRELICAELNCYNGESVLMDRNGKVVR